MKTIDVAVAVIHFEQQYLLGFRHAHQHQGNKYEFIGGKIENNESAHQALIREVQEEIAFDIATSQIIKMGRIRHEYADKSVCLHVYDVSISHSAYDALKNKKLGELNQQLCWVDKQMLINNQFELPEANKTILNWLDVPEVISITPEKPLKADLQDIQLDVWLDQLCNKTWQSNYIYYRNKLNISGSDLLENVKQLKQLSATNERLTFMLSNAYFKTQLDIKEEAHHWISQMLKDGRIFAQQLSHQELIDIKRNVDGQIISDGLNPDVAIICSCHDIASIEMANLLAKYRLNKQQQPVIGIFLSPVKPTSSHPDSLGMGWYQFAKLAGISDVPVIALGGLKVSDLTDAKQNGAMAVAGIRGFSN